MNHQSFVVAVILTNQFHTYVIRHRSSIIAILVSELVRTKLLSVALPGEIVAINLCFQPGSIIIEFSLNVIQVTRTQQDTEQVSVYHQSIVVQVIIQSQTDTYDTAHTSLTIAIFVSELVQIIQG